MRRKKFLSTKKIVKELRKKVVAKQQTDYENLRFRSNTRCFNFEIALLMFSSRNCDKNSLTKFLNSSNFVVWMKFVLMFLILKKSTMKNKEILQFPHQTNCFVLKSFALFSCDFALIFLLCFSRHSALSIHRESEFSEENKWEKRSRTFHQFNFVRSRV